MSGEPGYERSDMPAAGAALAIAGLLSLIAVGALTAWALRAGFESNRPAPTPSPFERAAAISASPRLEVDPRGDRLAIDRRARARLEGYGWTNRAAGSAHIPIERAMALQAAEGWPDGDTAPANPPAANAAAASAGR